VYVCVCPSYATSCCAPPPHREQGMYCLAAKCPVGQRQLFTSKSIKAGHYLLFFFAVVTVG